MNPIFSDILSAHVRAASGRPIVGQPTDLGGGAGEPGNTSPASEVGSSRDPRNILEIVASIEDLIKKVRNP